MELPSLLTRQDSRGRLSSHEHGEAYLERNYEEIEICRIGYRAGSSGGRGCWSSRAGHVAIWLGIGIAIGVAIGASFRSKGSQCPECAAVHRTHELKAKS
jgi:hypothetical protein